MQDLRKLKKGGRFQCHTSLHLLSLLEAPSHDQPNDGLCQVAVVGEGRPSAVGQALLLLNFWTRFQIFKRLQSNVFLGLCSLCSFLYD